MTEDHERHRRKAPATGGAGPRSRGAASRERGKLTRLQKEHQEQERKRETRRKLIAGQFVLEYLQTESGQSERSQRWWAMLLDQLTRDDDRAAFGLPPRLDLSPRERGIPQKEPRHASTEKSGS